MDGSASELEGRKRRRDLMLLRQKLQNAYTLNQEKMEGEKEDKKIKKLRSLMLAMKTQIEIEIDVRLMKHLRIIRLVYSMFEKQDFAQLTSIRAFVNGFLKEYADLSKVRLSVHRH